MQIRSYHIILCAILALGSLQAQVADTTMTIDFQVTTSTPGGNYSPRNIGAIWIESSTGSFVKTLRVWANNRRQHLYTWNNRTGGNTVDGVTGSTYSSHGTRTASWDFTDANGDTVTPGDYTLRLELTDQHSQGPLYSFSFPFMGATETITPSDHSHFHNMQLSYDLTIIVGLDGEPRLVPDRIALEQNFPNPFNPATAINFTVPEATDVQMTVFNMQGRQVRSLAQGRYQMGEYQVTWDGQNDREESVDAGVYVCCLVANGTTETVKMILLK